MKTEEQWFQVYEKIAAELAKLPQFFPAPLESAHKQSFNKFCRAIQLDAMREGMRRAAKHLNSCAHCDESYECQRCDQNRAMERQIIAAADALTEKDL